MPAPRTIEPRAAGYWQIPTVWMPGKPQGAEGGWNPSIWVGIDGAFGSDDVLQAGAEHGADGSRTLSCVAWWHSESKGQM